MNISDDELSIIVQGPTRLKDTKAALMVCRSARQVFPNSEIIVSCWIDDDVAGINLYADKLVQSTDPGGQAHANGMLNVNRQIHSTNAGLKYSKRKYTLKIRSDLLIINTNIVRHFESVRRAFWLKHQREPILISNLTTVNPQYHNRCFALCDWIYFGRTDQIKSLFSIPFYPPEYLDYKVDGNTALRYNAEQWIAMNFLMNVNKQFAFPPHGYCADNDIKRLHTEFIGKYFALKSYYALGIKTLKHRISSFNFPIMYTEREWNNEFNNKFKFIDIERLVTTALYSSISRKLARAIRREHN